MSTWNFAGDALKVNFCPECGSLLDLPNQIGNIECKLCNFICAAQDIKNQQVLTRSQQRVVKSGRLKKEAALDHRAKVQQLCEKCGNEEMYYSCAQLRSADEGQTTFFECTKCGCVGSSPLPRRFY